MTDPVVRARELAAVQDQEYDALDWMIEATLLLPVLCDIIDELRLEVMAHQVGDGYEKGHERGSLVAVKYRDESKRLEELNARLANGIVDLLYAQAQLPGVTEFYEALLAEMKSS